MKPFDRLVGQDGSIEVLRHALDSGRVHHAWIFHGPDGVGKGTAARAFAAALIAGEEFDEADPQANALLGATGHPDLLWVRREAKPTTPASRRDNPEPEDLRKFIVVDQIRQLSSLAALTPRIGKRRCFVIDEADRMNGEAQNALLKTLEEPPGNAVLILVASRPHRLLPTVRSRCFQLRFAALKTRELAALLLSEGVPESEALIRAALAEGRPGRARELDVDALQEQREGLLAALEALAPPTLSFARFPDQAKALAGPHEAAFVDGLGLFQALLRDAIRAGSGNHRTLIHEDLRDRLLELGRRVDRRRATELIRSTDRLRNALQTNVNRTLIAESLLAAVGGGPIP